MGDDRTASEHPHGHFAVDDYEEVNATYFRDLLREQRWAALPAGWHNPFSAAVDRFIPPTLTTRDHQQYALDEGSALGAAKDAILSLASRWEQRTLANDEMTLCPSVSCANLVLLCAMKRRGIDTVIFETPAYFATSEQARMLGLAVDRVACTRQTGFDTPLEQLTRRIGSGRRSAVWLTQPRFGIGTDQPLQRIRDLCRKLGGGDLLVVDEAGEQRHPSHLSALGDVDCEVIRTRGLVKGLGLNGLRLSMILHPRGWRDDIERVLETAGASIDRYSLQSAVDLAGSVALLPAMLRAANDQVCGARRTLASLLVGGWAEPTPLENSYIGSVLLDFSKLPGSYDVKRRALLEECRDLAMPVVLGASIGFAFDPRWEAVRMNYFTPTENVLAVGRLLDQVYEGVRARLGQA